MSDAKKNEANELGDDELSKVSGGGGGVPGTPQAELVQEEAIAPSDAASGLPTGKRMHKPFVITKEIDKASPIF